MFSFIFPCFPFFILSFRVFCIMFYLTFFLDFSLFLCTHISVHLFSAVVFFRFIDVFIDLLFNLFFIMILVRNVTKYNQGYAAHEHCHPLKCSQPDTHSYGPLSLRTMCLWRHMCPRSSLANRPSHIGLWYTLFTLPLKISPAQADPATTNKV